MFKKAPVSRRSVGHDFWGRTAYSNELGSHHEFRIVACGVICRSLMQGTRVRKPGGSRPNLGSVLYSDLLD
jgi:hypothetical protein